MAYKTFQEMIDTLRAGQAAGMSCQITLTPDAAGDLADILEQHQAQLRNNVLKFLADEGQKCDALSESRKAD